MESLSELSKDSFVETFLSKGYVVVKDAVDMGFVDKLSDYLATSIEEESKFHGSINHEDYGRLLACPIYGGPFLEVLENQSLFAPVDWMLNESNILYVYTSSSMPPLGKNKSSRIHVDRAEHIPNYIQGVGMILLLDDFTENNGATWVLPGSHKLAEAPEQDYFYKNAKRIIAPKGSIFYFDLRLWHAGGDNNTEQWRHSIAMGLTRPSLKQRVDLPKAMRDMDLTACSEFALQKLGFHSQPPASLDEYYAAGNARKFKEPSAYKE